MSARPTSTKARIGRRGLMLVLSSPSGAGKTTISRRLLADDDLLTMSVSVTTRPRRPGETEGMDYRFVNADAFAQLVASGELLEHANVFGHRYGTPRAPVEKALAAGHDILFDVDWQGTQQLRENTRDDVASIFILPPSLTELESRLRRRAQDSDAVIAGRMARAAEEVSHWIEYDYIIVNEDIDASVAAARAVLAAERLKRERQVGLGDFVRKLRGD